MRGERAGAGPGPGRQQPHAAGVAGSTSCAHRHDAATTEGYSQRPSWNTLGSGPAGAARRGAEPAVKPAGGRRWRPFDAIRVTRHGCPPDPYAAGKNRRHGWHQNLCRGVGFAASGRLARAGREAHARDRGVPSSERGVDQRLVRGARRILQVSTAWPDRLPDDRRSPSTTRPARPPRAHYRFPHSSADLTISAAHAVRMALPRPTRSADRSPGGPVGGPNRLAT
jgi:hypothetical protein